MTIWRVFQIFVEEGFLDTSAFPCVSYRNGPHLTSLLPLEEGRLAASGRTNLTSSRRVSDGKSPCSLGRGHVPRPATSPGGPALRSHPACQVRAGGAPLLLGAAIAATQLCS